MQAKTINVIIPQHLLDDVKGHLVDFPLEFLSEEILKPSIMPQDIHI